jgi:phage-related protein
MPVTRILLYRAADGSVPFLDWFEKLQPRIQDKCTVRLERLGQLGHELRRPEADYLRDGIYELRISAQSVHYRVLYFFHGREAVVVSHGLVKERAVPPVEIARAIKNKALFEENPAAHTATHEL